MSLLPYYLPLVTGSGFPYDDSNEFLVNKIRSQRARSHSIAPESRYVSTLRNYERSDSLPRSLVTRVGSISPVREIYEDTTSSYVEPYSTKHTLARLTDVLGRGDDSWLDRYVSDVHAPRTNKSAPRPKRPSQVRRRILPTSNYIYGPSLPGFYRYPREHHWSVNDPGRFGYYFSTPPNAVSRNLEETLGPKGWDWKYPYRSYTSNFRPCYLHYPRTDYLYPKKF